MIPNNYKNSLLIPSQLPEFIRENPDYTNFVAFLQSYYEWLEQNGNPQDRAKNVLNYIDIDRTSSEFLQYYVNDFLPYFPEDALISKEKAVKVARELYQTKGTPASYQFLFRILYNSDFDIFYTKDAVLKPSSGVWYIPKSLQLDSTDTNFLSVNNYRLFGETTKTIATIENVVLVSNKVEVFISNIERLFQSGEFVRVVDSNNQDVLFNGAPLRGKIVGQISQINIDPNNRGLLYQQGNPVVVYGGLSSNTGLGANAVVGTTTVGSIQRINVVDGGFGYSVDQSVVPHTNNYSLMTITNAPGANAIVASVNTSQQINVTVPVDSIALKETVVIGNSNYYFSNIAVSNANTVLYQALNFQSFNVAPISSILVTNGGGGISQVPQATANSYYPTDDPYFPGDLSYLGIMAPVQIANSGVGYTTNDTVKFIGGSGVGANAKVTQVDANGGILTITYDQPTLDFPVGGIGYGSVLPTIQIISANANAAFASAYVPGILGTGAQFSLVVDRVGSITTIDLINGGEDYVSAPNVSLKVEDILVSNLSLLNVPEKLDTIFQGSNVLSASYTATVNSFSLVYSDANPLNSVYSLRVFNYNSTPNPNLPLIVNGKNIVLNMSNTNQYNQSTGLNYNQNGILVYGDGNAQANAKYLNGLVIGQGQYITTSGQPSSYDVLQSSKYNNFTYIITVQKEIAKYRDILLNLLHPTGLQMLGRYAIKSDAKYDFDISTGFYEGYPLSYYTGLLSSSASMVANFTKRSNNIVQLNNLGNGVNIANIFNSNSVIRINSPVGQNVRSRIESINTVSNTITLNTSIWLTYGNVFTASGNANTNTINIVSLTGTFNIINNGIYSNTQYPLMDIVFANDLIQFSDGNTYQVKNVNYNNGILTLNTALSNTYVSSNVTVNRGQNYTSTDVIIYGAVGPTYIPEITDEFGNTLTDEQGNLLIVG